MQIFKILPVIFSLGLCLLFQACTPDEEKTNTENELGRPANEVIIHLDAEPDRLTPMLSTSNYSRTVYSNIFNYLLYVDPTSLELLPQLAKSRPSAIEITEGPNAGGMAYSFEIREEAVWDNGSPITGHDFAFTLKTAFNPKVLAAAYRVYLSFIQDVEIDPDNPKKFTVLTNRKYIIGEEAISAALPLLPAYHYDPDNLLRDIPISELANEENAKKLADNDPRLQAFADQLAAPKYNREPEGVSGSGAYKLVSWEVGQKLILERKADWWGDKAANSNKVLEAHPAKIIFRPITDSNTAQTALKDGQIDVMSNIPPKQFVELQETDFVKDKFKFHSPPSLINTFVYVNTRTPKLSDKKVRKALAHAINVNEINETAFYGYGQRSTTPVHPSFTFFNKALNPIPYSPETARALLSEAGWEDSNNNGIVDKEIDGQVEELSIEYFYTAGRAVAENIALLIQESAKPAGIEIKITPQQHAITQQKLKSRDYELAGGAKLIQSTPWEPKQDFHSEGDDRTGFANAKSDELIDLIQVTMDEEARKQLYLELQAMIYDESPLIFVIIPQSRIVIHKRYDAAITPIFPGYLPFLFQLRE